MAETHAPGTPPTGPVPRAPPLARDPWAWLTVASVLPLVLHSAGAPLGEPVAEDFDSLRHVLLLGQHSLLDGGGSTSFWRPVAKQLYYFALGPLMLTHPWQVAAVHVMLLAAAALLLYRLLRSAWPGSWAATAASSPLWMESARELIAWPSHFVNLGCLFFAVLALHEASRRRMITSMTALAGALLCKEAAVMAAILLPLMPGIGDRRRRARWALAAGIVVALWAGAYVLVRERAGLELPHRLETELRSPEISIATRFSWALRNSLRAMTSLPAAPGPAEAATQMAWLALVAAVVLTLAASARARERLRQAERWALWGTAWFVMAAAAVSAAYPLWVPGRAVFGALGMGMAMAGVAGAAHPALLAGLVALRCATFALSPGPPRDIAIEAPDRGAFVDFAGIVRLQRLMVEIRTTLNARYPALEPGSRVGQNFLPRNATHALAGDHALQVWYRDTTLRWVSHEAYAGNPAAAPRTIVQFQPRRSPAVALVEPLAMRALLQGNASIEAGQWTSALVDLAAADSLQSDRRAGVFVGTVASRRARCLLELGDYPQALVEARRALAISPFYFDARYVLADEAVRSGRLAEAEARLDTLLRVQPGDTALVRRLDQVRGLRPPSARPN